MKIEEMVGRLMDAVRLRGYSYSTEKTYVHWSVRFIRWLQKNPMDGTRAQKMERFLTSMAHSGVSPATQNQAFNAILFLCRRVFNEDPGDVKALRAKKRVCIRVPPPRAVTA